MDSKAQYGMDCEVIGFNHGLNAAIKVVRSYRKQVIPKSLSYEFLGRIIKDIQKAQG